jgi:hypothetical protein
MQGTYLLATIILACLIVWPEESAAVLTSVSLKIQIYWINWRMKCQARKLHRQLSVDMKKHFGSEMPPFEWVDIWDRDS